MSTNPSIDASVKLFVGQIPKTVLDDELRSLLANYGSVQEVSILRDKITGMHRGCAFAKFATIEEAEAAITALNLVHTLPGGNVPMQLRLADGEAQRLGVAMPENPNKIVDKQKLFVGSLPRHVDHAAVAGELRNLFSAQGGQVLEVFVMRSAEDSTPGNAGCAFVKMATPQQAQAAINALNNVGRVTGADRPFEVRFAEVKKKHHSAVGAPYGAGLVGMGGGARFNQNPMMGGGRFAANVNVAALNAFGNNAMGNGGYNRVPAPWVEYTSPEGRPYYYNATTNVTTWDRPIDMSLSAPGVAGGYRNDGGAAHSGAQQQGPAGANLFAFHLPIEWGEQDLVAAFSPFGPLVSARIMIDKETGKSRGFGFVSYDNAVSASNAIAQMNGYQILGKRLKVSLKKGEGNDGMSMGGVPMGMSQARFAQY